MFYQKRNEPFLYTIYGISFQTNFHINIPLLLTYKPPEFYLKLRQKSPFSFEEWESGKKLRLTVGANGEVRKYQQQYFYYLPNAAHVLVTGNQINAFPLLPQLPHLMEMEVLENVMAGLLAQKGYVVFHAAAVAVAGGVLVLAATSGSGKSSLTVELVKQGAKFLSDDVVVIHQNEEKEFIVYPSHQCLRLNKDSAAVLLEDKHYQPMNPLNENGKVFSAVNLWGTVETEGLPLGGIIWVNTENEPSDFALTQLKGSNSYTALVSHAISFAGLSSKEQNKHALKLIDLLNIVPFYELNYPKDYNWLPKVANNLIEIFTNPKS